MSLDQNLMGLGLPAPLAMRLATGGTGPVNFTATSGAATIGGKQFLTFVNSGSGNVTLPKVGGADNAPEVADDFVIHNGLGGNVTLVIPSGVTLNVAGAQYSTATAFTIGSFHTLTAWVQSATQWFGVYS
jgi:hypothetical protein